MERGIFTDFIEFKDQDVVEPSAPGENAIFAIDANVLLNLYKFNRSTAREVLDALGRMSETLFVPHQALHEFWSRREDVQRGVHHSEAVGKIESSVDEISRVTEQWLTRTGLGNDTNQIPESNMSQRVRDDLLAARAAATRVADHIRRTQSDALAGEEWVLPLLESTLKGRVGEAPTAEARKELLAKFVERVKDNIPPGTRDVEVRKGDATRAFGDYFIWSQCIQEAQMRSTKAGKPLDLTLVTNDLKDDWVRFAGNDARPPLAHRHLIREYHEATRGQFRIRTFRDLLDIANAHFGAEVSEQSRAQVDAQSKPTPNYWNVDAAIEYLNWLWSNYQDQLKVLLASYAATQMDFPPLTADEARVLVGRDSMAGFGTPYTSGLKQGPVLRSLILQEPMLKRMPTELNGPYAYQLTGSPEKALHGAIYSDPDFIEMLNEVTAQLLTRERGDANVVL
jgi:hypothetical protein